MRCPSTPNGSLSHMKDTDTTLEVQAGNRIDALLTSSRDIRVIENNIDTIRISVMTVQLRCGLAEARSKQRLKEALCSSNGISNESQKAQKVRRTA